MVKNDRFTFKLDVEERRLLELLAHRLQRTQSDTMRWLLRQTAAALIKPEPEWDGWGLNEWGELEEESQ